MGDAAQWLAAHPYAAKSLLTGFISGSGPVVSHYLSGARGAPSRRKVLAFFLFGTFVTGPVTQTFYQLLEQTAPSNRGDRLAWVKKLLIDRLCFAPPFLLLFLLGVALLEGKSPREAWAIVRQSYWPALKANWKVWTLTQYINLNHVPLKLRSTFASVVALGWNAYLALLSA